jgi:hypothetical protein
MDFNSKQASTIVAVVSAIIALSLVFFVPHYIVIVVLFSGFLPFFCVVIPVVRASVDVDDKAERFIKYPFIRRVRKAAFYLGALIGPLVALVWSFLYLSSI